MYVPQGLLQADIIIHTCATLVRHLYDTCAHMCNTSANMCNTCANMCKHVQHLLSLSQVLCCAHYIRHYDTQYPIHQYWSVHHSAAHYIATILPLHCHYIATTLPLHCHYIATTLPLPCSCRFVAPPTEHLCNHVQHLCNTCANRCTTCEHMCNTRTI